MRALLVTMLILIAGSAFADDHMVGLAGGDSGDRLAFVGDSLTLGIGASSMKTNMPEDVSALFGDGGRRFRVFAAEGATASVMARVFLAKEVEPTEIAIIWLGRNAVSDPANIKSIGAIAAHMPSGKYLVLSILPRSDNALEAPGTPGYDKIAKFNADLAAAFGDHFVEVGKDTVPADHSDSIHFNDAGYAKIAAAVHAAIVARGW